MLFLYGTASSLELFLLPFQLPFTGSWPPLHLSKSSSVLAIDFILLFSLLPPFLRNEISHVMVTFNFHVSNEFSKVEVKSKTFFVLNVFLSFCTEKWLPTHFWRACVLLSPFLKNDRVVKVPCYCQVLLIFACTLLGHKENLICMIFFLRGNTVCCAAKKEVCWMYGQPNVSKDVNLSFYTASVNRVNFSLWFLWPHLKKPQPFWKLEMVPETIMKVI